MSEDPDWLDIGPPQLPAIVKDETKYNAMIAALKKCSPKQRAFLSALHEACFDEKAAHKALAEQGTRISWQAVRKWRELEPWFVEAQQHAIDYALAATGVSYVGVLTQLMRSVRVNGATVKRKTEQGVEFEEFVDATNHLHALDKLGKRLQMYGAESDTPKGQAPTGGGLHITFVHNAAPQAVNVGHVLDAQIIDIPAPKEISK